METKHKKKFDCVEMKNKAAEPINKHLMCLSVDEQLKYWMKRKSKINSILTGSIHK